MSGQPDFTNLLDDQLFTTAQLLGLLKSDGPNAKWFNNPAPEIEKMFSSSRRDLLLQFVNDLLGSSNSWLEGSGSSTGPDETWHSIPQPDGSPTGLYLVLSRQAKELVVGFGGVYQKTIGSGTDAVDVKLSGKIPVVKVADGPDAESSMNWSMVLGESEAPSSFTLRLGGVSGNLLKNNPLNITLGGVSISVTLGSSLDVQLVFEQLQLPGETTPRDRTLSELADSFNMGFVLNMLLDGLADETLRSSLRKLLGLDTSLPAIDWDALASGNGRAFNTWFSELRNQNKVGDWLQELGSLLGLSSPTIQGSGTRSDPWQIALGDSGMLANTRLTLGVEGSQAVTVFPGLMVSFDPLNAAPLTLQCAAKAELAAIDLQSGALTPLPTIRLDATLQSLSGSLLPQTTLELPSINEGDPVINLQAEIGSAYGSITYESGRGFAGSLELHRVDMADRHWQVMDLNSVEQGFEALADQARAAVVSELKKFLGISGASTPFANRIGALLGLNAPLSSPSWAVDLVVDTDYLPAFLNDPLAAVAWYHSRSITAMVDIDGISRTSYNYIMQDLWHLLFGESSDLEGYGSDSDPWKAPLFSSGSATSSVYVDVSLEISTDHSLARPLLCFDLHAVLAKSFSNTLDLDVDLKASLMDMILPDSASGQQEVDLTWLPDAVMQVGFGDLPPLSVGMVTIDGEKLAATVNWSRSSGFDYDLALTNIKITYSDAGADTVFDWPSLHLPKFSLADGDGWSFSALDLDSFGPIILKLFGQWLATSTPRGFALAGLLGLLPDMDDFSLPGFPSWKSSPWALPDGWPTLSFDSWSDLLDNPWPTLRLHLANLFSKPEWAIPALRWLGALLTDSMPNLTLPDFDWDLGLDSSTGQKRFPALPDLPFVISGHGTYPDPWRLRVKDTASKWHKGAILVWIDPDGPQVISLDGMLNTVVPHLSGQIFSAVEDVADSVDLNEVIGFVGSLGSVNQQIASHLKGFDSQLSSQLLALQNWLVGSDGFGRVADPLADLDGGRLRNTMDLDGLPIASHNQQLQVMAGDIKTFISGLDGGVGLRLVLAGGEQTSLDDWQPLLDSFGLGNDECQSHDFCQFGVAPDQQELELDGTLRVTMLRLTAFNSEPAMRGWLAMDSMEANTPARQLRRVLDHLQSTVAGKVIFVCHSTAGLSARIVMADLAEEAKNVVAGVCTIGMPEMYNDAAKLPGVVGSEAMQGLDFLKGLITEGAGGLHSSIADAITALDALNSPANHLGYGDAINLEEWGAIPLSRFTGFASGVADSFAGVSCKGFYSRIAASAAQTIAQFDIKEILLSWLSAQLSAMPSVTSTSIATTTASHIGFGLSWEDMHQVEGLSFRTETRCDLLRYPISNISEDDLQILPRFRLALEARRSGGWLVGGRTQLARCRWLELGVDIFSGSSAPSLTFHDAGVNGAALDAISLDSVAGQLWSGDNQVRLLLDNFCVQLPTLTRPLSCFFESIGLFYKTGGSLMPHADSWQALLTDPDSYIENTVVAALNDPERQESLFCIFEELFGLKHAPFISELILIMKDAQETSEARIALLIMEALGLFRRHGGSWLPIFSNWIALLQNPKNYLATAWHLFMDSTSEAQAHRALLVAEISVEYCNIDSDTDTPVWLHNLQFDGNALSFTLGGEGFTLLEQGASLRIPLEIDLLNGQLAVRYEVDISGTLGVSTPVWSASAHGGVALFFEIRLQPGEDSPVSLDYGIDLGGGVSFDLAEVEQWEAVLRRLLTQGLGSRFLTEIVRLVDDDNLKNLLTCLSVPGQALLLPGGREDWHNYIDAGSVRCLLNSLGGILELRDGTNNIWRFGEFELTYPDTGSALQLGIGTVAGGLSLYSSADDQVVLRTSLSLLFPEIGPVEPVVSLGLETSFSGVDIALFTAYDLSNGASCRLTADGITLQLLPFAGFDSLLGAVGQALLDQCLPAIFSELKSQFTPESTGATLCSLAHGFSDDLGTLRSDPTTWLTGRLQLPEVSNAVVSLWPGAVSLNNGTLTCTVLDGGTPLLVVALGSNIGCSALGSWGVSVALTPPPMGVVDLDWQFGCCLDHGVLRCTTQLSVALVPDTIRLGGISISPALVFDFDNSRSLDPVQLKLEVPAPGGSGTLLALHILPELDFDFQVTGSVERLVLPMFDELLEVEAVAQWLKDDIGIDKAAGTVFKDLGLLLQIGSGTGVSYSINPDLADFWQDSNTALTTVLSTLLGLAADYTFVSFEGSGGISVVRDGDWYGVRVTHPGISLSEDPDISLVLGGDTNWLTKCGLHNGAEGEAALDGGLSCYLLKKNSGSFDLGCRFVLSDIGVNFQGKGNANLFDVGGFTTKGINLHCYLDMDMAGAPIKWAMLLDAKDMGLPLHQAAGSKNPVAGSLLSSSGGDTSSVNPGFDFTIAYGRKLTAFLGDSDSADGVAWVDIGKQFGPIYIKSLGVLLEDLELSILIDGKVELMGLTVEVDDLSITLPLNDLFNTKRWELDCKGLGVSYQQSGLTISGALLKDVRNNRTEYRGVCIIETSGTGFAAIGAYTQLGSDPSLFVFMVYNGILGGPPVFFVRGLAGGFGYNRDLRAPEVEEVDEFALVEIANAGQDIEPLDLIDDVGDDDSFPAVRGAYWFGVGVKFTTFELFKSFGMLYVLLNRGLEVGLLGVTKLEMPEDDPLVHVVMNFKALFSTRQGIMLAQAQLSNDSWLLSRDCRLQGGFAVASWFDGPHKGDFVITLGGYHSKYKRPEHYPDVPRLGFNWQVSSKTSIKGLAYFALTSNAVMAGGELDASYVDGNLKAWFRAWAHFLIQWKPFLYDIEIGVSIGASYRMSVKIPFIGRVSKTFKIELGGDLHIWGPDFSGTATLNWWVISFTVRFGAKSAIPIEAPLDWIDFRREFLPSEGSEDKYWQIHSEKGLLEDLDGSWLMKSECVFRSESVFPTSKVSIGGTVITPDGTMDDIDIRPMRLTAVNSTHIFDLKDSDSISIFADLSWTAADDGSVSAKLHGDALVQLGFDLQEVAKALWLVLDDADDSLDSGEPVVAAMGMSVRLYIDNAAILNRITPISLDQNDFDSSCILPLPFYHDLRAQLPGALEREWVSALELDRIAAQGLVAAIYSDSWQARRIEAISQMRQRGVSIIEGGKMVRSRLHHLAARKAIPKVATLYNGIGVAEGSTRVSVPEKPTERHPYLGWTLSVMTLAQRRVVQGVVLATSVDKVAGADDLPRISLDRFRKEGDLTKGRVLKSGQSQAFALQQAVKEPRVLLSRGREGGASQRVLQQQLYRGLDTSTNGAVLKAGMVHIWSSSKEVGADTTMSVKGSQTSRICCFDRGGKLLMEQESIGNMDCTLPKSTRRVVLVGLGDGGGLEVQPGLGVVSLRRSVAGSVMCGWSSSDMLPLVSTGTILARGAVLQSREQLGKPREPGIIRVAEFLNSRGSCVTHLPSAVRCVAVLLARKGAPLSLDGNIDISFPEWVVVTKGRVIRYADKIMCLYGVTPDPEHKQISEWLSVTVKGQNGWMLAGVCAGRRDLDFWENKMDLTVPPTVEQEVSTAGELSEVTIKQADLHSRLIRHKKFVKERAAERKSYANIWRRERV